MNIISSSYGNDSIALIQWAHENDLPNVTVVYCDTGWSAPNWIERVSKGEELAKSYGFNVVRLKSMGMEELVRQKKGFPGNAQQFCTMHLKGVPFLMWLDEFDHAVEAKVLIGKRRAESRARANTPEFLPDSEYHGGRGLWHPLYKHTDDERNRLVERSGMELLPHRSRECEPCVNANRGDFLRLEPELIARVSDLEVEIGKPMFRPKRFNAVGIYGVMRWAEKGKKNMHESDEDDLFGSGCDGFYGCGL